MDTLRVEGVVKRFGAFTAVDHLDFAVREGEIYGFLGGNGAGKTTTLRMALDILRPDAGSISVLGQAPGRANASEIGFLPEERGLYRAMTSIETIIYFGRLKGMTTVDARKEGMALLERFDLAEHARNPIEKLSKGMTQKVQLATALVNKPRLLILDEPFSGLDPLNQTLLEDEILTAAKGGASVIFSTHVMQHAERLCDRLLLLAKGRKRFEGTQDEARATLPVRLTLTARQSPANLAGVMSAAPTAAAEGEWQEWGVQLAEGQSADDLLETCTAQGFALRRFDRHRASLHEVFVHVVGGEEDRT
jgi:ABC-2 type transport system ATP-binding protein